MSEALSLKPIEADFESKISQAVEERARIDDLVAGITSDGLRNVFFVGAGGSIISSYPAVYLLQQRADLPVFRMQSDEFNTSRPARLGTGSLVVLASHTGTTKETVAAARYAHGAGATVMSATKAGSPLADASDHVFCPESDVVELLVAYSLLEHLGVSGDYEAVRDAIQALPKALLVAQEESEDVVHSIATDLADAPITYVLGSGPCYGWAYGLAMCYLQEMQWKHAVSFNSGEFFQGAFEMVDGDLAVILILGEDPSRPMGERAQRFLQQYDGDGLHVIDTRMFTLPGIPSELRGELAPLAIRVVVGRLANHYEAVRDHDLDQRRYMFKVEY